MDVLILLCGHGVTSRIENELAGVTFSSLKSIKPMAGKG